MGFVAHITRVNNSSFARVMQSYITVAHESKITMILLSVFVIL